MWSEANSHVSVKKEKHAFVKSPLFGRLGEITSQLNFENLISLGTIALMLCRLW